MNAKEAARVLGVSESKVRLLARLETSHPDFLPHVRIGARLIFDEVDVRAYQDRHRVGPTRAPAYRRPEKEYPGPEQVRRRALELRRRAGATPH